MARIRDWAPCSDYGEVISVTATNVLNVLLLAPRDTTIASQASLAQTEIAVLETENDIIANRVVGQVVIESDEPSFYGERIRMGILDNAGARSFFANSTVDALDANEPFLWQRFATADGVSANNLVVNHPYWSCIDVRVSRRIRQGFALFYTIENVSATATLRVRPLLRTLGRVA